MASGIIARYFPEELVVIVCRANTHAPGFGTGQEEDSFLMPRNGPNMLNLASNTKHLFI